MAARIRATPPTTPPTIAPTGVLRPELDSLELPLVSFPAVAEAVGCPALETEGIKGEEERRDVGAGDERAEEGEEIGSVDVGFTDKGDSEAGDSELAGGGGDEIKLPPWITR